MRIKSKHCIGLLEAIIQCLQGHQWIIQSKHDLDVILKMTMCVWISYNLLINHTIPQDWMVKNMESEEDEEQEHHNNERANQHDQILASMVETH